MLIVTLLVLLLLTFMAVGVLTVTGNALHLSRLRKTQASAFNLAESGAEMCALWFRGQAAAPSQTSPFDPLGGPQTLGDGQYAITVYPDAANAGTYLKTYRIVSTGTVRGVSKKVEIVLRQATFGRFAYFTDKEVSSISGGAIWWTSRDSCDGPAHSNNTGGSNFQINYNNSTGPIFKDMLTAAGTSINYNPGRPTTETAYRKVYEDGSKGFKLGVPRIELPDSTDIQRNAAWGGTSGFPGTNGVYLRASTNGGIYVSGDCTMQFSVPSPTTQRIVIKQGTATTTINVDLAAGTSVMTLPNGTVQNTGMPNGAIFCTGNITSLQGQIADNYVQSGEIRRASSWTIATDVNAGKDIKVTSNLTYRTRPDKTQASDSTSNLAAGTLGLVAYDVEIPSTAPQNMEIDAVCLAGSRTTTAGSFFVNGYNSKTPVGTLTVLGGIIQKARGPVGTFNASTGSITTGYGKNYSYDPRLATNPPPFFPTTGTYERLSWRAVP